MKLTFCNKPGALVLLLAGILSSSAMAQRDAPTAEQKQETRDERRARIEQMTPEQRQQYFSTRMQERLKNMTPEQRSQWEARRTQMESYRRQEQIAAVSGEDRQRYLMKSSGIEDNEVQDAIMAFVMEQAQKRKTVTDEGRQLSMLLADANTAPEAFTAQFTKLQTAAKEFRTWKEGALKELDAKVKYSTNPRLHALLVLVGIVGDEGGDAGGFNAMFPKGLAGDGDIATLLPPVENNFGGPREGTYRANGNNGGAGQGQGDAEKPAPAAEQPAAAN